MKSRFSINLFQMALREFYKLAVLPELDSQPQNKKLQEAEMSISMSFEAKRNKPLTEQEQTSCAAIVERYSAEYPFNKEDQNFMVLTPDQDSDIVYSSFTKLPSEESADVSFDIAGYWMKCFTELTYALPDCQYSGSFEGVELIFDPDKGWRFLTQEEYEQRYCL